MNALFRSVSNERQGRQLELLLLVRLLAGLACIGAQVLSHAGGRLVVADNAQVLLIFACTLSLAYLAAARWTSHPQGMAFWVMGVDLVLISLLIYLTGGNQSNYTYLYFGVIVGAGMLVSQGAGVLFASTATVCLSAVTTAGLLADHYQWNLPLAGSGATGRASQNVTFVLGYLLAQGVALHLVALLSGSFARYVGRLSSLTDSILKQMAGGLIVADAAGRLQYVNATAKRMLGFDENEEMVGRYVKEVLRRNEDLPLKNMLLRLDESEREMSYPSKAQGVLYIEAKTGVMRDGRGRGIGIIALLTDLTEKCLMKEAQRQAETLAGIEEMAAGIAHEIRNPLASIRGSVQELAKANVLEDDHRMLIQIVMKESDRLDRIITDFLRFTRMRPTEPESCNLAEVLSDVATLIAKRAVGQGAAVDIRTEFPDVLPCTGDREQLKQLVLNLALNGVEEMEQQGGKLVIAARRKAGPDAAVPQSGDRREDGASGVLITVTDSGRGIPPERMDRIFTPFYTTKKNGTGMGLSIVQKIVTAHCGTVGVERNLYGGSTFKVWIPDRLPQLMRAMKNKVMGRERVTRERHEAGSVSSTGAAGPRGARPAQTDGTKKNA